MMRPKKAPKSPATLVDGILAASDAYSTYQAEVDRLDELRAELAEAEARMEELQAEEFAGVEITGGWDGGAFVKDGHRELSLAAWRAEQEAVAAGLAVLDGPQSPTASQTARAELVVILERRTGLKHAIPLQSGRVETALRAAMRDLRPRLQAAYHDRIADAAKTAFDFVSAVADDATEFLDALSAGLGSTPIHGLPLLDYANRPGSRTSRMLNAIRELPES